MNVSGIAAKMIEYFEGNLRYINHFMKVYAYARTIGECEGLDENTQTSLELAAIIHDIACPLCREKYGNANGKHQEREGQILAADFLKDAEYPEELVNRVIFLVGHHHTLDCIAGLDYQILIEADYIVNADESSYPSAHILDTMNRTFGTPTGVALLKSIYGREQSEKATL